MTATRSMLLGYGTDQYRRGRYDMLEALAAAFDEMNARYPDGHIGYGTAANYLRAVGNDLLEAETSEATP